ncbi:MAG: hypothetical protein DRJ55_01620 [Thermoprotei archaeon]|nr:MAG: hypothetical protein DRJ55_01620 [Thermoprotei archaeon]HDJ97121.1 extracellular solute-binding protein [Thermofilum sp.]
MQRIYLNNEAITKIQAAVIIVIIVAVAVGGYGAYWYFFLRKPYAGVKITFLTPPWGVPPKDLLHTFEDKTGITVEVVSVGMSDLFQKVAVASSAGQAPADVIFLGHEALSRIVAPGWLEPLDNKVTEDMKKDIERLDEWRYPRGSGPLYGITVYVQMVMIDYDSAKLKELGYSSPPSTWDEFVKICVKAKQKGLYEYPVAFGARSWSWYIIALSKGDPMFDENLNPTFNGMNAPGREAFQLLIDMFRKYKIISPERIEQVNPHPQFWAGQALFHQAWQGSLRISNDPSRSKVAPNAKYMLMPEKHYTWTLDAAVGISKYSKHKDAAWEFIKWYTSKEVMIAIFNAYGLVPARKSAQNELAGKGLLEGYDVMVEQAKYIHPLPYWAPWWGEFDSKATELIQAAARGEISPDDAVDQLAAYVMQLKEKYGG